jgi:hypothetical protein
MPYQTGEDMMQNQSYIVEDLEDETHEKIKELVNLITDRERIPGKNMKKTVHHFSYTLASNVIRLIKDGYVQNPEAALNYTLVKTGIILNDENEGHLTAWMDVLESLRKFNGGYLETHNCQKTFTIFAENIKPELYRAESGLPFTRADLLFEIYKKDGRHPHISLFEHTTPIRVYKKEAGERRDIRYEVIHGLIGIAGRPKNTTYKSKAVQNVYMYHHDSGHGWLEVPARELQMIGLQDRITPHSYLHQGKAYLEEDIDAWTFMDIRKLLPKLVTVQNNFMNGMCPIRNYPHYDPKEFPPERDMPERKRLVSRDAGRER